MTGCEDCLAALLDHDAFVLCRDFKGRTPIHLASACGHTAVLRTLLQAALSTDPLDAGVDYSGYSPMHWASYTGTSGAFDRHRDRCCRRGSGSRLEGQRQVRADGGSGYFSPSPQFLPHAQDMKIVWSCYLNTARSHTWRGIPSLLCTVQCKHRLNQPLLVCWPGLRAGRPSSSLLLMIPPPHLGLITKTAPQRCCWGLWVPRL